MCVRQRTGVRYIRQVKLLVFAHTPPPFHGQSYMVKVMVDGFGGDRRDKCAPAITSAESVECYHVNARVSDELTTVGTFQFRKLFRIVRFCAEAIWCRFRYGVDTLYYIPASPKRIALYRDWIVFTLCRPFFRRVIFHWHACGLAAWLDSEARPWERSITHYLARRADLALCLSPAIADDAAAFEPHRIQIVANGIRDPCPDFAETARPKRRARAAALRVALTNKDEQNSELVYRVLFLGTCSRSKGLFDAIAAMQHLNRLLMDRKAAIRANLTIAGLFVDRAEQQEFETAQEKAPALLEYVGFASTPLKHELLRTSDCLCFPSYYPAEAQPVSLIEAMAFGLSIVTTDWRAIPEMFPSASATVRTRDPLAIAEALSQSIGNDQSESLRENFLKRFTQSEHLASLRAAIRSLGHAES